MTCHENKTEPFSDKQHVTRVVFIQAPASNHCLPHTGLISFAGLSGVLFFKKYFSLEYDVDWNSYSSLVFHSIKTFVSCNHTHFEVSAYIIMQTGCTVFGTWQRGLRDTKH